MSWVFAKLWRARLNALNAFIVTHLMHTKQSRHLAAIDSLFLRRFNDLITHCMENNPPLDLTTAWKPQIVPINAFVKHAYPHWLACVSGALRCKSGRGLYVTSRCHGNVFHWWFSTSLEHKSLPHHNKVNKNVWLWINRPISDLGIF